MIKKDKKAVQNGSVFGGKHDISHQRHAGREEGARLLV
jgi:hypothetical protein